MADNVEDQVWLDWLRKMDKKLDQVEEKMDSALQILDNTIRIMDDMTRRMPMSTYDDDIIAWSNEQARLLRERRFDQLDLEHIAEEIESVAWAEQHEFAKDMSELMYDLLRWQHRSGLRCSNWREILQLRRESARDSLRSTPSLRLTLTNDRWLAKMWSGAVLAALKTGLDRLPKTCPWTMEMVLAEDFLPD